MYHYIVACYGVNKHLLSFIYLCYSFSAYWDKAFYLLHQYSNKIIQILQRMSSQKTVTGIILNLGMSQRQVKDSCNV